MTPACLMRLLLAISLVALLVLMPVSAIATGDPNNGGRPEETRTQGQPGQSQGNQSQQNQSSQQQERGPPEDTPGQERRPVDPVAIRDNATGFRTEAPPGSQRPEFTLDAAQGSASIHRGDIEPMTLRLDALVEYIDENQNGAYDLGEPVQQRTPLRGAPFEIVVDNENETRDIVYTLEAGGQLILRFHLGQNHGESVATKFDVIIDDYPFSQDDSRLAIGMNLASLAGLQTAEVNAEPALAGKQGAEVPYLSWEQDVIVDGVRESVGASIHLSSAMAGEDAQSAIVFWSYPQGASIIHDPIFGVTESITDRIGDLVPFLIGTAAAIGLLGAGYMTRRRTRL